MTSMNSEEFLAYILADDNQLQDLGNTDIKLQPDNTPRTLNDVMETHVQEPQNVTSLPNIDNQYLSRPQSSDEISLEEFLISFGVARAPSQALYQVQQETHNHSGAIGNLPLEVPRNETNRSTEHDPLMNANARRVSRTVRTRQQRNQRGNSRRGRQT